MNFLFRNIFFIIVLFQILTLFLFYFGPIHYISGTKSLYVFYYVFYYILALILGYALGGEIKLKGSTGPKNVNKFLKYSIFFVFLFGFIDWYYRVGTLNILNLNPGELYNRANNLEQENNSYQYFKMFFGVFLFGFFPIFLQNFKKININLKILGIVAVLFNIALTMAVGVNKILFDYLIIGSIIFIKNLKINIKNILSIICIIFFAIAALIFFIQGQITREGSAALSGINYRKGTYSDYNVDDGTIYVLYGQLSDYIIQGYRVLDLAQNLDFKWTYGFGNSYFLSRQAERIFGIDVSSRTYPVQASIYGIDQYIDWSTFYVWWASDLTFIGVGGLMFFIGLYFKITLNTYLANERDISANILFYYFIILLFYLSANNQVFQSPENLIGFLYLFIPFIFLRKYKR